MPETHRHLNSTDLRAVADQVDLALNAMHRMNAWQYNFGDSARALRMAVELARTAVYECWGHGLDKLDAVDLVKVGAVVQRRIELADRNEISRCFA